MRFKRDFFENIIAEIVARFIIGLAVAGLAATWVLPDIARFWDRTGWTGFLVPIAIGAFYATVGVRKGPGVI